MRVLIIVESPIKAFTISRILKRKGIFKIFSVVATKGHIKDFPKSSLGIFFEESFGGIIVKPRFCLRDVVYFERLMREVKRADEIYLATDPDREGEAIAYHLYEEIIRRFPGKKVYRARFYAVTEEEILQALGRKESIDYNLYQAFLARKVVDRIIGWYMSGLVSRALGEKVSIGRVQTPGLCLINDSYEKHVKEGEKKEVYLEAMLSPFYFAGLRYRVKVRSESFPDEITAEKVKSGFSPFYRVVSVEKRSAKVNPPRTLTTTGLIKRCGEKYGFSAGKTMKIAQRLFEKGYITYPRTDSHRVSEKGLLLVQEYVRKRYGDEYLQLNTYEDVGERFSQDAHECIRPATMHAFYVEGLKLSRDEKVVLREIRDVFVASQMKPGFLEKVKIKVVNEGRSDVVLQGEGVRIISNGFFVVLKDVLKDYEINEGYFFLKEGQVLGGYAGVEVKIVGRPPLETEESLIDKLEKKGIGRPSTYSQIVPSLLRRGLVRYVEEKKKEDEEKKKKEEVRRRVFIPTYTGKKLVRYLKKRQSFIVDFDFTARLEEELEKVAKGEKKMEDVVINVVDLLKKDGIRVRLMRRRGSKLWKWQET